MDGDAALGVAWAIGNGTDVDSSLSDGHADTGSPYTWYLDEALNRSLITEETVDAALRNTLRLRFQLGQFL